MDIAQMHTWFRTYAQQMGMQNVRAILPEQIDILINTSINDSVNQLIAENVGVTNDRVITDNSKIGQINSLRTLYKVAYIDVLEKNTRTPNVYTQSITWNGPALTTGQVITFKLYDGDDLLLDASYDSDTITYNTNIVDAEISNIARGANNTYSADLTLVYDGLKDLKLKIKTGNTNSEITLVNSLKYPFDFTSECIYPGLLKGSDVLNNFLFLVDFSLNYIKVIQGINPVTTFDDVIPAGDDDPFVTNYFPVRLIDDAYLADTLNDFVLKPRLRSPILTIYNGNIFDLYVGRFVNKGGNNYTLDNNLLPYKFRIAYIAKPAVVKLAEDVNGVNIDCDLPENMHIDILKHAVDLYRVATSGALYNSQRQEQAQQQDNVRNNYRNEGYQQPTQ